MFQKIQYNLCMALHVMNMYYSVINVKFPTLNLKKISFI